MREAPRAHGLRRHSLSGASLVVEQPWEWVPLKSCTLEASLTSQPSTDTGAYYGVQDHIPPNLSPALPLWSHLQIFSQARLTPLKHTYLLAVSWMCHTYFHLRIYTVLPLDKTWFPLISMWLAPSSSGLCSNVTFSVKHFVTILQKLNAIAVSLSHFIFILSTYCHTMDCLDLFCWWSVCFCFWALPFSNSFSVILVLKP